MDKKEYDPNYDVDFNRIKIAFKVILIIALFFITFSLFSGLVNASEVDLIYTPTQDVYYNATSPVYDEQFNIRNQTEYTGIYNATYSFTDDSEGSAPIGWTLVEPANTEIIVRPLIDRHEKFLRLTDSTAIDFCSAQAPIWTAVVDNVIEFFFRINSIITSNGFNIYIEEGATLLFQIIINEDDLSSNAGIIKAEAIAVDTWYHLRLDPDDSDDTYDIYLDGSLEGDDIVYSSSSIIGSTKIRFGTGTDDIIVCSVDALGITSDPFYEIGDNIIPIINTLEINEVDKWEFALQTTDVLNPIGLDDPNGWTDYEESGDIVNIQAHETNDRRIYMFSPTFSHGIYRDTFPLLNAGDIYDVSFNVKFNDNLIALRGNTTIKIYSSDATLVCFISLSKHSTVHQLLQYIDGNGVYQTLNATFDDLSFKTIEYNIYINYNDNIAILRTNHITSGYSQVYMFPLMVSGKSGISQVFYREYKHDGVIACPTYIDNIGIYSEGKSLSIEMGWKSIDLPNNWDLRDNNLFEGNYTGWGNFSVSEGIYAVGVSDFVRLFDNYYGVYSNTRVNLYTRYVALISNPYLIIYQVNFLDDPVIGWIDIRGVYIDELIISGVKLVEGSNEYPLIYTYSVGFTEPLDNYFYVSDSLMRFTLTCENSNLEYIQANFDISDVPTVNRSVKTDVFLTGSPFLFGEGALSVKFSDATTLSFVFVGMDSFSQIMPQDKVIEEFAFLITDDDRDVASGNTMTGYLRAIELVYYPNLGITIITTDLLLMLIPLFVLILPPLALYKKFGYKIVIPMMMVMSIVSVAGGLIPYWMFFVLIFCFVSFILVQRRSEGGGFL